MMWWNYQECSSCVKLVDHRHDGINIQFDIIHFVLVIIIICSKPVLYQRCFVLIVSGPNCNACMMLQPLNLQKYWYPIKISIQFSMVLTQYGNGLDVSFVSFTWCFVSSLILFKVSSLAGYILHANIKSCHIMIPSSSATS